MFYLLTYSYAFQNAHRAGTKNAQTLTKNMAKT